ncbi:hypothetical protein SDC9_189809 [bioreactor metagenome]|uniref:Uncharacterized protein n=1 Tax=bioreactor metagenome TaxID=1076179 RepID=A0A645I443_9ZZZZ
MAIIIRLDQLGFAEHEFAELALAERLPRQQRAPVETLVVFDADEAAAFAGFGFDFKRLLVLEHQRLDAENMLVVLQHALEHPVMELVGQRDDDHLVGLLRRQHLFVQFGIAAVAGADFGHSPEAVAGECFRQRRTFLQRLQRALAHIHHRNIADQSVALHLQRRRQQEIVHDHAGADDGQFQRLLFTHDNASG